ncbi:MAG: dihydroorotase family protein [Cyanobacteria bacterium P01_A01_bin.37]
MVTEWLRQVRVIDPLSGTDQISDVWVVDGVIAAIAPPTDDPLADGSLTAVLPSAITQQDIHTIHQPGLVLAPGLVDLYSHSGEPGYESRETLKSLAAGAIAGGFSRLTLLPDTHPVLDNPASIEQIQHHIQRLEAAPQVSLWGTLTLEAKGEQMAELGDLAEANVVGFADGVPLHHSVLLRRVLEYGQVFGKPIALWPCDRPLSGGGSARESVASIRLGLVGNPAMAETTALAALLEAIADIYGADATQHAGGDGDRTDETADSPATVHIMRVSTARSVELIRSAKAQGLPITASTTWMHLLWTVDDLSSYDPNLHLDPPLGTATDQAALIHGVRSGIIDAIAIDHSPYTYEEKTVAFAQSPPGAIGLEVALGTLWERFVASGQWTALELWAALSLHPALCLNQSPPTLMVGHSAEMVLFDPEASWQVTPKTLKSQSSNTPLLGQTIRGKVLNLWT